MFRFISQVDVPTPLSEIEMKWFIEPEFDITIDIGHRNIDIDSSFYVPQYDLTSDFEQTYVDFVQKYGTVVLERYEKQLALIRAIARGAFGTIYNVRILSHPYAIKMEQRNDFLDSPSQFEAKVKKEFSYLKQVSDTGSAPRPYEYGLFRFKEELFSFLTMELIPNSDTTATAFLKLRNAKSKSKIIVDKVFELLQVLYSLGIVHGDLHWNNLYIQAPPDVRVSELTADSIQIKVLDFGMAFSMTNQTRFYDLYSIYISSVSNPVIPADISMALKSKLISLGLVPATSTLPQIYAKFKQIKK